MLTSSREGVMLTSSHEGVKLTLPWHIIWFEVREWTRPLHRSIRRYKISIIFLIIKVFLPERLNYKSQYTGINIWSHGMKWHALYGVFHKHYIIIMSRVTCVSRVHIVCVRLSMWCSCIWKPLFSDHCNFAHWANTTKIRHFGQGCLEVSSRRPHGKPMSCQRNS